ncbi:MAG: class I SAM-dependent methyltransferase [Mucilaginibacter sp.]
MIVRDAHITQEQLAAEAFSRQSVVFDELYADNTIVSYKRHRVRSHVLKFLKPGGQILELNSGTGDDALFFAAQGFRVHATDVATGMQQQLQKKVERNQMTGLISQELCSYIQLQQLQAKGPYDCIFSNFAGLNCTGELDKVLASFNTLLKPDGIVTLVVLPPFCLWEFLLIFKGKFRTAFRRFFSKRGRKAHLEGTYFNCWYYEPSYIVRQLKQQFDVVALEGLCTLVPPSYIEGFAEKYPATFRFLQKAEDRLKSSWPWVSIGDYYVITLRKKREV